VAKNDLADDFFRHRRIDLAKLTSIRLQCG